MDGIPSVDSSTSGNLLQSLSNYFDMSNIDLKDLNITTDHLKYFIEYLYDKRKNSTLEKPSFPVKLFREFEHGFNRSATGRSDDDSITVNHLNWISNIYSPSTSVSQAVDCECYCGGVWREGLLEYKTIHGYIALVVRLRGVKDIISRLNYCQLIVSPTRFCFRQICLFGTLANIFNVIVLTRKEMSKAPINMILKWLAVTDIFVMVEYIPFSIYMYLIFPGEFNL